MQDVSNLAAEAAALGIPINREAKPERTGTGGASVLGIYRAGGPTTIFGGSGWGPYSDGPLNAVRKSFLNREGLNEENWMLSAAQRTLEADDEWKRIRRDALKACGGILGEVDRAYEEDRARRHKRSYVEEEEMDGGPNIDSLYRGSLVEHSIGGPSMPIAIGSLCDIWASSTARES